jgi:hypothetical protein
MVYTDLFVQTTEVPVHVWEMRKKWSTGCGDTMKGKAKPVEAGLYTLSEIQGLVLENTLGYPHNLDFTHLNVILVPNAANTFV